MARSTEIPVICHRCGKTLCPGSSDHFVVKIEAYADPTAPTISSEELQNRDFKEEMGQIVGQIEQYSAQELYDDIYRRLIIHLCGPCYRSWIENPV